jgi:hypothetical protein
MLQIIQKTCLEHQTLQKLQNFANQDIEMWISRQTLREYLSAIPLEN